MVCVLYPPYNYEIKTSYNWASIFSFMMLSIGSGMYRLERLELYLNWTLFEGNKGCKTLFFIKHNLDLCYLTRHFLINILDLLMFKGTPPPLRKIFPLRMVRLSWKFQGWVILVRNASGKNFSSIGHTRPISQLIHRSFLASRRINITRSQYKV